MTESARYLTNALDFDQGTAPQFDNNANGMTDLLLTGLRVSSFAQPAGSRSVAQQSCETSCW